MLRFCEYVLLSQIYIMYYAHGQIINMCSSTDYDSSLDIRDDDVISLRFYTEHGRYTYNRWCHCFVITDDLQYLNVTPSLSLITDFQCLRIYNSYRCDYLNYTTYHDENYKQSVRYQKRNNDWLSVLEDFNSNNFNTTAVLFHQILLFSRSSSTLSTSGQIQIRAERDIRVRVQCTRLSANQYLPSLPQPEITTTTTTTTLPPTSTIIFTDQSLPTHVSSIRPTSSNGDGNVDSQDGGRRQANDSNGNSQAIVIGAVVSLVVIICVVVLTIALVLFKKRRKQTATSNPQQRGHPANEPVRYVTSEDMEAQGVHMSIAHVGSRQQQRDTANNTSRPSEDPPSYAQVQRQGLPIIPDTTVYANVDCNDSTSHDNRNADYFEDCSGFRRPDIVANIHDGLNEPSHSHAHENGLLGDHQGPAKAFLDTTVYENAPSREIVEAEIATDDVQFEDNDFYNTD